MQPWHRANIAIIASIHIFLPLCRQQKGERYKQILNISAMPRAGSCHFSTKSDKIPNIQTSQGKHDMEIALKTSSILFVIFFLHDGGKLFLSLLE